ncbi:acyl-CoA dehydrogenase [Amycolatopsis sp. A1MSW2902]|uniref:acyl-CoA dehydrogenase family protein n=1 Tax=Amycolatopsis sp. A1MSW2902 TaxID=687413 RepID=UPI00307D8447
MKRHTLTDTHEEFRASVRDFIKREVVPDFHEWEQQGHPPRDFYRRLGELGILGLWVPEEYGGGGATSYAYAAVLMEEIAAAGVGFGCAIPHSTLILAYLTAFASPEQKARWLPGVASGETLLAIAMTEPGTGSDLANISTTARLAGDGSHYVLNGAKTFISGGSVADLVLVVCRTAPRDPDNRRAGLSILAVDTTTPGFSVGRRLEKIGLHANDLVELAFDDVVVPVDNLLGDEGRAFEYLSHNLAQERLSIALTASAAAQAAVRQTVEYVSGRTVFGKHLSSFQNTKFSLAASAATVEAMVTMTDRALELFDAGDLAPTDAAKAKLFCTEQAGAVIDQCLQLHGGYGYITEYPIARLYADIRVARIYGGTSEVMKLIIAKSLGL